MSTNLANLKMVSLQTRCLLTAISASDTRCILMNGHPRTPLPGRVVADVDCFLFLSMYPSHLDGEL